MKQCKRIRLLLPAYFDKKLDTSEKKEVEEHIKVCPDCSAEFARVEQLVGTLQTISGIELPKSIAEQLAGTVQTTSTRQRMVGAARVMAINRRHIYRTLANIVYVIVMLVCIAFLLRLWIPQGENASDNNTSAQSSVETTAQQPPVSLRSPAKPKAAEPGVESLEDANANDRANRMPQPQVKITHARYDRSDVDDAKFQSIVRDFSLTYNEMQVAQLQNQYVSDAARQAAQAGEDQAMLQTSLKTLLSRFEKPALPAYIEKVRFEGKNAWIIVIVWSAGGPGSQLSNVSAFVIDPTRNAVMYTE
ncbi:MAG TPA: zf-HC2 domain-containing protein [Candidatus Aquicultor sp.]|jgi:hypothetical protein